MNQLVHSLVTYVCATAKLSVLVALSLLLENPAHAADQTELTYESHIRPIFREHCFDCHGATQDRKGDLDLRLVRFLLKGGESGAAIVASKPDESYLLDRVRKGEMPPGEKRLPEKHIRTIERWIAAGAKTARPEPESMEPGLGITPEERSFWSFQPIQQVEVPEFSSDARVRSPIDAFILAAMPSGKQIGFSPDADRRTVIKRLFVDVIGIIPSPDEMARWMNDKRENWYELLVDDLLASPHYGERWARHWLDVAGYADSEGYTVADSERPWAWKYRDYVIRSLNADKPFDRFITEQLAGDELAGPRKGDLTAEQIELFTATGFLRMAADGTGSGANNAEARNQVIADTLRIVSTSLLGLSVQCAQCHDHRYDPIPHTDYFALRAIFEPALDWKKWQVPSQRRVSLYTAADRKRAAQIEAEAQKIAAEKSKQQTKYMAQALDQELKKFEEPLRGQLRTAYETPVKKRTPEHRALLDKNPSVNINAGVLYQYLPKAAEELKKFDKRIAETRAKKPKEEFLRTLIEPAGHAPSTYLFHRGDFKQPKQVVEPAGLTVASRAGERQRFKPNDESQPTTGRRLAFAKWLTGGKHPLVARVLVNRIWMHHFGRGIVATPSDFGKLGVKPTHPKLLDWLATRLMADGWSLKKLHRLILTSTVWRQSSRFAPSSLAALEADPTNRFYWRRPVVRLEAEALRDCMLAAAGTLDRTVFGPPIAIKTDDVGQIIVENQTRRSMYIKMRRSQPVAMLQAFDAPVMETNCEYRPISTAATQSLMLMNGEFVLKQSTQLANRATKEAVATKHAALANLPTAASSCWSFGYGEYDEKTKRTGSFAKLPHWTGSHWQGGPKVPDPKLSFAILHANGGHTGGSPKLAVIRRWTAFENGVVDISGTLRHPVANGNGVRGRAVSSRSGLLGESTVHNSKVETAFSKIDVQVGDTIDFITDYNGDLTSDSFSWPVKITTTYTNGNRVEDDSKSGFHGPLPSNDKLPGQAIRVWQLALCREPTDEELQLTFEFLARQIRTMHSKPGKLPKGVSPGQQAITNLCQTLLISNEFLYVD
jgi:mono/diheme cytochrome c family protein